MARMLPAPTRIVAHGNAPKVILEHVGRVATGTESVSVAHMRSPPGWAEPGQRPAFDEYTLVLRGTLRVEREDAAPLDIEAGQAVHAEAGQWVRYSTPGPEGAEYVAVCVPGFSPATVRRDAG